MGFTALHINNKEQMKIDAIIGNPPYQVMDGGGGSSSVPIYHRFIDIAKLSSSRYISMIMPARWYSGGKGLDIFREEMIKDKCISILHDFMDSSTCFGSISIEGGICYFLRDSRSYAPCNIYNHLKDGSISTHSIRYLYEEGVDIFIRDIRCISILKSVLHHKEFKSFGDLVFPRNPFGLVVNESDFRDISSNNSIKVFGRFDNIRQWKNLRSDFPINRADNIGELINKCKVFVSKADGAAGQIGNPIPARIIGKAEAGYENTICTETFLAIGPFETHTQADNVVKYMQTKFFRFLVGIRKTKNMTRDTYKFAPLLDFTQMWSDNNLYEYFNLSSEDREYINKMIDIL